MLFQSNAEPATSFFLGILFNNWAFDHRTLWTSVPPTEEVLQAVESHYKMLSQSPPIIARALHTIISVGILAFVAKLYKPSESNMLFDGASLALYMVGLVMYLTNILQGLQIVEHKVYSQEVGRVDSLRVIAASEAILALVLVGVLVLQAGQWYAENKEREELKKLENEDKEVLRKIQEEKAKKVD